MKTRNPHAWKGYVIALTFLAIIGVGFLIIIRDTPTVNKHEYKVQLDDLTLKRLLAPFVSNQQVKTFYGIDVSHWNGSILQDIGKDDSLSFAICKATQGVNFVDPDFRMNWSLIGEKNWIRGAYHFYEFGVDPLFQARHFWETIEDLGRTDIAPILDVEQMSLPGNETVPLAKLQVDLLLFLDALELHFDRTPIIYADLDFANTYLSNPLFAHYDLWLGEYSKAIEPQIPKTWVNKGYKIWQKTAHYNIQSNYVDFDVFTGQKEQLCE